MDGTHRRHHALTSLLLVGALLAATAGCGRREPEPPAPAADVRVGVTIPPQMDFARTVGGRHVAVTVLVQPGGNPHTYEPTPQQMAELAKVDVYFLVGVPFEKTLLDRLKAVNPRMRVVDTGKGITLRSMSADELAADSDEPAGHHDEEGNKDPHTWLDPANVKIMAKNMADALIDIDPAHKVDYADNLARFDAELDALDAYIRERCKDLKTRDFMVYHPAFGYFAQAYGLKQVPIELEGKEPSGATLAATIGFARARGIRVIFVQQQFSRRAAQAVAEAIGGRVVAVDPLAEDYVPSMKKMADAFLEAMR
jgi:zinc transport system substrate-binding protein